VLQKLKAGAGNDEIRAQADEAVKKLQERL